MRVWTVVVVSVLSATIPSLSFAQLSAASPVAYFSVGKTIRSIAVPSGSAAAGSSSLVFTGYSRIGDLALCADGQLYFAEPDARKIRRLLIRGNGVAETVVDTTTLGSPAELRLTATCALRFATPGGIYAIDDLSSVPVDASAATRLVKTTAGSGLAIAFDGSTRHSDAAVVRGQNFGPKTFGSSITGLGVANGGAGTVSPAVGVASVCAGLVNRIDCTSKAGTTPPVTLAQFGYSTDTVQYWEFLTSDAVIAATSVDPIKALKNVSRNGALWMSGRSTPLYTAPKVSNYYDPIVGVAVGPSLARVTEASPTRAHRFAFGPVLFEATTPSACALSVAFTQLSWAAAQARVDSIGGPVAYGIDPPLGEESWVADFDVKVAKGACGSPVSYGISGFLAGAFTLSRGVLQCRTSGTGPACEVQTTGDFPYGAIPGDATDTGSTDNFGSDYLTALVAVNVEPDAVLVKFQPPLSNASIVTDPTKTPFAAAAQNTFSPKRTVPIKFTLCADPACKRNAPPDRPNYPFSGAMLAVQPIAPGPNGEVLTGPPCTIDDPGNSSPDKPLFRITGSSHHLNLKLPLAGPPECQQRGVFAATVSSLDGRFVKQTFLFTVK